MGKKLELHPQTQLNKSRTSFDMGQTFAFTASTGMILPIYKDLLNVSETVYLNSALICRTQPIVTAAMADVNVDIDWFFVPMSMLFTAFPSIRYMTNDLISSFYDASQVAPAGGLPQIMIDYDLWPRRTGEVSKPTDYEMASSDMYDYGGYTGLFGAQSINAFRLADMLGYNPAAAMDADGVYNPTIFPWAALAYQCIYQDYFRDDDKEIRKVETFNVDKYYSGGTLAEDAHIRKMNLFCLRFRNRYRDYFQSVRPAPYLSAANLLGGNSRFNNVNLFGSNQIVNLLNSEGSTTFLNRGVVSNDYSATESPISDQVFTSNIRASFAVEKLLRVIGRSKKDYDSQILAHFGFKVPHDVKHELTHLFTQHGKLHIGEIVSSANTTTETGGSALGEIGGKGYVFIQPRKKAFKFTAPVDGVIMAVFSAVPEIQYVDTFDRQNAVTSRYDFYTPELDNLGSQPVYRYELDSLAFFDGTQDQRYGWQYRYMQWKQKYNRASWAFARRNYTYGGVNVYSAWVLGMNGADARNTTYWEDPFNTDYSFLNYKSSPHDLDGIMQVPYNSNFKSSFRQYFWEIYQTDPFICQFRADVDKVSPMSPYGEPNLNGI